MTTGPSEPLPIFGRHLADIDHRFRIIAIDVEQTGASIIFGRRQVGYKARDRDSSGDVG